MGSSNATDGMSAIVFLGASRGMMYHYHPLKKTPGVEGVVKLLSEILIPGNFGPFLDEVCKSLSGAQADVTEHQEYLKQLGYAGGSRGTKFFEAILFIFFCNMLLTEVLNLLQRQYHGLLKFIGFDLDFLDGTHPICIHIYIYILFGYAYTFGMDT